MDTEPRWRETPPVSSAQDQPEDRLFADAASGDGAAAETLLQRYLPRLRAFVRSRLSPEPLPVIVVGGGSILVDGPIGGLEVIKPHHFAVANAVGAAIAQVSGEVDRVYALAEIGREQALADAKQRAVEAAVAAGALRDSIEIVDVEDVPLAYLPGNATRVRIKAVGELHVG